MSDDMTGPRSEEVSFEGKGGRLAGTLTAPGGVPRAAVLILSGSGQGDRDGKMKELPTRLYAEIADVLTGLGCTTLRYDKRGVGQSPGDIYSVGMTDRVDDAESAVAYMEGRGMGPVVVLGHSEGCILGVAVNRRHPLAGLILLAGPCEPLSATSERQRELGLDELRHMKGYGGFIVRLLHVADSQERKSRTLIDQIMSTDVQWIKVGRTKINARWIREHFRHDIATDLPFVECPALAITGAKDIQVLPEHAEKIAGLVKGPSEWHVIDGMTHLLRRTTKSMTMISLMKIYREQAQEPVDKELVGFVKEWLDRYFPVSGTAAAMSDSEERR